MDQKRNHSITVDNRQKSTATGIDKVISATSSSIVTQSSYGALTVYGNNLKITKFDDSNGVLVFVGEVNEIRYGAKTGFWKKLLR